MVILCYGESNKIYRYLTCTSDTLSTALDLLNTNNYKVFEKTTAYCGLDIRSVNEDGSVKPISEQVDLGFIILKDDEVLDGETIKTLTEQQMKEKYPERYPKDPEPTELEKIEQEIENMEYTEGYRLLRENGKNSLLSSVLSINDDDSINQNRKKYKELLIEKENIEKGQ